MKNPKKILVVRTDRIGDVVLSIPIAEYVKKYYPNCKVDFLLTEYTKDILFNHPFIDDILIFEEGTKNSFKNNLAKIKLGNYDTVITVNPTLSSAYLIYKSRIINRIGTGYRWYSFFFNRKVYEHRKHGLKHELQLNINLLKILGISEIVSEQNINYHINFIPGTEESVNKKLTELGIPSKNRKIIIHPGSGGSAVDLPINKFKELISKISKIPDVDILITGSKNENRICSELNGTKNSYNLSGKFSLAELIRLISQSAALVSNSTGPIHLGAALGKTTFGFYPKIPACSKERWSPFTINKYIYEPQIDCKDCTRKQCEKLNCMNTIDIDKVYEDIKNILRK